MRLKRIISGIILSFLIVYNCLINHAQTIEEQSALVYFGQKAPGLKPEIFAPNLISFPDRYEFGSTFSKDGKEFFFAVDSARNLTTHYSRLENGVWSQPEIILQKEGVTFNDPMLTPDEQRLFFISNGPTNPQDSIRDINIWYVEKTESGWSSPINPGSIINSKWNEYYPSFTQSNRMYFSSNVGTKKGKYYNFDIYYADQKEGSFLPPVKLGPEINTEFYEADVYIAPDESYIIFCARRDDSLGEGDLYISFKDENGNWMPSKHLDAAINTEYNEFCPFVTADGKYLFYTSNEDIYWVSTEILERYR